MRPSDARVWWTVFGDEQARTWPAYRRTARGEHVWRGKVTSIDEGGWAKVALMGHSVSGDTVAWVDECIYERTVRVALGSQVHPVGAEVEFCAPKWDGGAREFVIIGLYASGVRRET